MHPIERLHKAIQILTIIKASASLEVVLLKQIKAIKRHKAMEYHAREINEKRTSESQPMQKPVPVDRTSSGWHGVDHRHNRVYGSC